MMDDTMSNGRDDWEMKIYFFLVTQALSVHPSVKDVTEPSTIKEENILRQTQ